MSDKVCRVDFDDTGCLDDVAIDGVKMFRLEYMSDNSVWICLIMNEGPDHVFWLNAKGKIDGVHRRD